MDPSKKRRMEDYGYAAAPTAAYPPPQQPGYAQQQPAYAQPPYPQQPPPAYNQQQYNYGQPPPAAAPAAAASQPYAPQQQATPAQQQYAAQYAAQPGVQAAYGAHAPAAQQGYMGHMGGAAPGMMGYERIFPCVKLRGLPFEVTEDEIRMFLGTDTVDILFVRKAGRPSGEAFVLLPTPHQMGGALHRDKTYLGKRYVEVFRCGRKDYYKAIATQVAEGYDGTAPASTASQAKTAESFPDAILKLRGLPFSATSHDIVTFFNDNNLALSRMVEIQHVRLVCLPDGRPNGQAYVEFANPEDAAIGYQKNKQMVGARYVEMFPATREEMEQRLGGGGQQYR